MKQYNRFDGDDEVMDAPQGASDQYWFDVEQEQLKKDNHKATKVSLCTGCRKRCEGCIYNI